jgi:lysophospholipase L1-like esterase
MNDDFYYLKRYEKENSLLSKPVEGENRIVFLGDSITEFWLDELPSFFEGRSFINRGISGQTTPQMLGRFEQDVLSLNPNSLHLLAGTNDIAGNTGEMTIDMTLQNIHEMIRLAKLNQMNIYIGSVLPASSFGWKPLIQPAFIIKELNEKLKELCHVQECVFIDYHQAMQDSEGGMNSTFSDDGVHPNKEGYMLMESVFEQNLFFD